MWATALASGNTRLAARMLKAEGYDYPRDTLEEWKHRFAERYQEVMAEVRATVGKRMAEEIDDLARRYADAQRATIDRYMQELPSMGERALSGHLRNLATARGISTDKGRILRDEPTSVIGQHKSADELWAQLKRIAPHAFVDSTADERRDRPGAGHAA